jgi:hypothetical protein
METFMREAGIDTWSLGWYLPEDGPGCRAMKSLATQPVAQGGRVIPEAIAGHRVGWFPKARLLFAEGHPASENLAGAADLPGAAERLSADLQDYGVLLPQHRLAPRKTTRGDFLRVIGGSGFAGIRRFDSTVNRPFEAGAEGLAALAGLAEISVSRRKTHVIRQSGGRLIETVYYVAPGGKSVLERMYDKGVESGTASRGEYVRFEAQLRFCKSARPPLEALADSTYVRDSFVRRFEPLWKASKGVIVGDSAKLAMRLGVLVDDGTISITEARSIAGHLTLDAVGLEERHMKREGYWKQRARARDHGLVLAGGSDADVEVDLASVLESVLDSECWN